MGNYDTLARHLRVRFCLPLCLIMLLALFSATAFAQVPERQPAFVYATNSYTPNGYVPAIYPSHLDTIYWMADRPNALAPRNTLIYWWPIDNEYRADWTARNELLDGTLEVHNARGQVVHAATLADYVVQYDSTNPQETLQLISGAATQTQYDEFVQARNDYWEKVREYQKQNSEYSLQLDDAVKNSEGGTKPQPLPPKPTPPRDFTRYSSVPVQAFSVNLPAGEYRIRLRRPDGTYPLVAERKLVVFAARRQAISYTIVPQSKWTVPEHSDDPAQAIYVPGRATLYFQPFLAAEFNDLYYRRLQNPQSREGRSDKWQWVNLQAIDAKTLRVTPEGSAPQAVPFRPYRVNQLTGAALGYEVVDYDPKTMRGSPSFEGFKLEVDDQQPSLSIALLDADGRMVSGSQREVRLLQTPSPILFYALPFVSFVIGGALMVWRRSRLMKLPRDAEG